MAGDWIAMRTDLWEDPKVIQLASAMCPHFVRNDADKCLQSVGQMSARLVARCAVIGALQRTWSLFDTYSDDGTLHGYDAETVNEAVGLPGWAENLHHVGWLEVSSQSVSMIDFEDWMGDSAKRRIKEAKRKRQSRKTSASCPQNVRTTADKKRTRGEERREEDNKHPSDVSAEHSAQHSQGSGLFFLCKSSKGNPWELPAEKLAEYETTFGEFINVRAELGKARQWLIDNPANRKTPGGMKKFLTGWLNRANDRGTAVKKTEVAEKPKPRVYTA